MLPVRALLSGRVVTRSYPIPWLRFNSTRHDASNQDKKENNVLVETDDTHPLAVAPAAAPAPATTFSTQRPLPSESNLNDKPQSTAESTSTSSSPSGDQQHPSTSDKPDSWKGLSTSDLEVVKQRIREWTDQAAINIRERADDFTAQSKATFSQLGAHLNKVTGYEEIEALKREVVQQEEKIKLTREAAKRAKLAYEQAVIQRSNSQREVNDLLQRKSLWTDTDVGRFTSLVRQDHLYEQEETRAKAALDETEAAVEREFTQLMKSILGRYHEEQVWSDKIRSASTYGSLAVLGLNLVVFILAIVVVEPWKRRRLAQTFETKIEELSVENAAKLEGSMKEIGEKFVEQGALLSKVLEEVSVLRELRGTDAAELQKVVDDKRSSVQVIEVPISTDKSAYISIPGVPVTLPQRTFELAAVGIAAFLLGVFGAVFSNN